MNPSSFIRGVIGTFALIGISAMAVLGTPAGLAGS